MLISAIVGEKMPDISDLTYAETDEEFVDVEEFSNGAIAVEMKYYLAGRKGSINKAYLRRSVAKMLVKANALLPEGYRLKVYDAWRPYEVQKDIFDEYLNIISADKENAGKSYGELCKIARTFVSFPDKTQRFSYVHSSGGAVDLTIIDENGEELDMGCGFDDFTELAATAALEGTELTQERNNRRLLYHVMSSVGFTNYPSEWWHYDYGDIFWGAITGEPVMYLSVYSADEISPRAPSKSI